MRTKTIRKVPQWAVCYLVYNDDSSLDEEQKRMVDGWYESMMKERLRPICPIDGTYSEFEPFPAFGLASDTVDFTAEILPKTKRKKK